MRLYSEFFGLKDFAAVDQRQRDHHAAVLSGTSDGVVMGGEHPAVITSGAHYRMHATSVSTAGPLATAMPSAAPVTSPVTLPMPLPIVACDRGGRLTVHSPGQLVIYPILPVRRYGFGTKAFVDLLELTTLGFLRDLGLADVNLGDEPGLFCGRAKVASIGIRIDHGVSRHGLAINISNDLSLFGGIETCGIIGRPMTSVVQELPQLVAQDLQLDELFQDWFELFHLQLSRRIAISHSPQDVRS